MPDSVCIRSIDERPEAINNRVEFGHWEIDTVIGKQETAAVLLTLDERTTRYRHVIKIASRSAQAVENGIRQLQSICGERFHTVFRSITSDNGSEFSSLPLRIFFTLSYLILQLSETTPIRQRRNPAFTDDAFCGMLY